MTFTKQRIDDTLTVKISGRLDSTNCKEVEQELKSALAGVKELVFDLEKLEYLSSAGLRIIVSCQKTMNKQGEMRVCHVGELVKSVFDITGISSFLNIVD